MWRRIGTTLLVAGSAALVWCLTVLAGAALYQWHENRLLEQRRAIGSVAAPAHRPELHDVIGRLEIPRLHVSTIVVEGDDDRALRLGAGHVPGTALPQQGGNVAIAAHRDTFFRPLQRIVARDRITLATPARDFLYIVESTEIVRPDAVRVLAASRAPELTLVTCYPFCFVGTAPLRFIVHARRIG